MKWPIVENDQVLTWESLDVDFSLENVDILEQWMQDTVEKYEKVLQHIHYIFCSDEYMIKLNRETLQHDFYTDIITFPLEEGTFIEAEAVISIERVMENADEQNVSFQEELHRVMIHAVLHLVGLSDKSAEDKAVMRMAEDEALSVLSDLNNMNKDFPAGK